MKTLHLNSKSTYLKVKLIILEDYLLKINSKLDLNDLGLIIECVLYYLIRPFGASYIQVRHIFESVL